MLLARLQREHERAPPVRVDRLADDAARHPPDVVGPRGEKPVVGTAVGRPVAGRLAFADRHRAPVRARRLEHAERHRVDVRDRERAGLARRRRELRRGLEAAEEVRLLEEDCRRVGRGFGDLLRIGRPVRMGDLDDLEPEAGRVRLHDLPHLRVQRLRENDLRAVRDGVLGDEAGVGGHRRAVVPGRVGHVHPGQLADDGLVLEDRLQHALAHLGLVRRVRGQELAAREDDVDDRGDVVVVDPCAEERELGACVDVPCRELLDVAHELGLPERGRDVELAVEADAGRHLLEELVDRGDADRREHLLAVGVGEREVALAHWSATCARYASASSSDSASAGSDTRMRKSHPSP